MTTEQVAALGPAFGDYLGEFRRCFVTHNTFAHLGTYCRGLLSDRPRRGRIRGRTIKGDGIRWWEPHNATPL